MSHTQTLPIERGKHVGKQHAKTNALGRLAREKIERHGKRGSQGEGEGGSQDSGQHNHAFKGKEITGRGTDKKQKAFESEIMSMLSVCMNC